MHTTFKLRFAVRNYLAYQPFLVKLKNRGIPVALNVTKQRCSLMSSTILIKSLHRQGHTSRLYSWKVP